MSDLQAPPCLVRRRLAAATALDQMSSWLAEGYTLHGLDLPTEAHVSVAMGFAGAMRVNRLLDALDTGPGAAMSLVAAVLSGPCQKSSPHAELVLAYDTVVAAEGLDGVRSLDADTTDVRFFMWRLNKLTRRLGSNEIAWDGHSLSR